MDYPFTDLGTHREWLALGQRWKKPRHPLIAISSLDRKTLLGKEICIYTLNTDRTQRDFGLVRPAGSTTPTPDTYFWIHGINSYR